MSAPFLVETPLKTEAPLKVERPKTFKLPKRFVIPVTSKDTGSAIEIGGPIIQAALATPI